VNESIKTKIVRLKSSVWVKMGKGGIEGKGMADCLMSCGGDWYYLSFSSTGSQTPVSPGTWSDLCVIGGGGGEGFQKR